MFEQLEYLEILFKDSHLKFNRCLRDESSIRNELLFLYRSALIRFFNR